MAPRTSLNIWNMGSVKFSPDRSGNIHVTSFTFTGSNFPSHRLWDDGLLISSLVQGPFSSLWRSDVLLGPAFVTRDGTGPFMWPWYPPGRPTL